MNKSFYIFYICPFFLSASLFAQQESMIKPAKQQKKTDKQPLLVDLGDVPPAYPELISDHEGQQTASSEYFHSQALDRQPKLGKAKNNGFHILVEDDDTNFDPRGTAQQPVAPAIPLLEQQKSSQQTTTISTAQQQAATAEIKTELEKGKQTLHTQYIAGSSTEIDEPTKIKTKARIDLMVLMDIYYLKIDDNTSRTNIQKALLIEINKLRRELPQETGIDKWLLNQPIDSEGNTIAHRAALNLDVPLLQMFHMMGVDIFKENNQKITPKELAHRQLIYRSPLSDEQKKLLLEWENPVSQESDTSDKKVKRKKKQSSDSASSAPSTTITTITPLSVQEQKAQQKYQEEQIARQQKIQQDRYKRYQKLEEFYLKVKNKK